MELKYELADFVSATLGFVALGLSWWQVRRSEKLMRLSARPILTFNNSHFQKSYVYCCEVRNSGLGPAIVTAFAIKIDGKLCDLSDEKEAKAAFDNLPAENVRHCHGNYTPGDAVAPNESLIILRIDEADLLGGSHLCDVLSHIEFKIEYMSVYGDRFSISQRADHYFMLRGKKPAPAGASA
jgi:hypothetical protein